MKTDNNDDDDDDDDALCPVLQVCTYSGSSSDTETEAEGPASVLGSPQRTLVYRTRTGDSGLLVSPVFLPSSCLSRLTTSSVHSGPDRGDPEERRRRRRGEVPVNHGVPPARREAVPVQTGRQTGRQTQREWKTC